jgi:LemA protein
MAHASTLRFVPGLRVLAVGALCAVLAGCGVNTIPSYEQNAKAKWSEVLNQYKRRADLIPNLVETVKAYAAHEHGLFEEIAAKRTSAMNATDIAGKAAAEQELQGSLHRLFAVAEAYPQLKANQNFLALQNQIAELEDQLQMARRYYNGAVRDFNIAIQSFPDVLLARLAGFHEEHFFQADAEAAANPSVSFPGQ